LHSQHNMSFSRTDLAFSEIGHFEWCIAHREPSCLAGWGRAGGAEFAPTIEISIRCPKTLLEETRLVRGSACGSGKKGPPTGLAGPQSARVKTKTGRSGVFQHAVRGGGDRGAERAAKEGGGGTASTNQLAAFYQERRGPWDGSGVWQRTTGPRCTMASAPTFTVGRATFPRRLYIGVVLTEGALLKEGPGVVILLTGRGFRFWGKGGLEGYVRARFSL